MYQPISGLMGIAVAQMLHRTLAYFPPPAGTASSIAAKHSGVRPLGSYLLELGYITPEQLASALNEQSWSQDLSVANRLGDILVQQQIVSEKVLATVLLLQAMDRLLDRNGPAPQYIGEYLLLTRHVTPEQLAMALEAQLRLSLRGKRVRLGDLLVRMNMLTKQQMMLALNAYQRSRSSYHQAVLITTPQQNTQVCLSQG